MQVPVKHLYQEVTGAVNPHIDAVRGALDRWRIPYTTSTPNGSAKKFWKVDIKYMDAAKAAWKLEEDARLARAEKKKPMPATNEQPHGIMERMAAVEQELRTLNGMIKPFIEKFQ